MNLDKQKVKETECECGRMSICSFDCKTENYLSSEQYGEDQFELERGN